MKLTYRGTSHDYSPPSVETGEVVAVGNYRGSAVRVRKQQGTIAQQPGLDLKYRGVAYANSPVAQDEIAVTPVSLPAAATAVSVEPVKATASTEDRMRSLMMSHHRAIKQREQSMLSRFASEVGLSTEFAAQYWNPIQGKINHTVWDVYDRSHAALS